MNSTPTSVPPFQLICFKSTCRICTSTMFFFSVAWPRAWSPPLPQIWTHGYQTQVLPLADIPYLRDKVTHTLYSLAAPIWTFLEACVYMNIEDRETQQEKKNSVIRRKDRFQLSSREFHRNALTNRLLIYNEWLWAPFPSSNCIL